MEPGLLTIGHSNHAWEAFLGLLRRHEINAVGDVRSSPFSRFNLHYNADALARALKAEGVVYVALGAELGARRSEPECYDSAGVARYERIAELPAFRAGLDRVRRGAEKFRLALMCAEKDPLTCHRTILVCRHLRASGPIGHVLEGGEIESHASAEARLLDLCGIDPADLFSTREELVERAYEVQGAKIAYRGREDDA